MDTRDSASIDVVFRTLRLRRRSDFRFFHGSMSCLHVPLSTLREQPCDCPRMTRSRCGSLGLHRMALSSTPSRRIIPAHLKAIPNALKTLDSCTVGAQSRYQFVAASLKVRKTTSMDAESRVSIGLCAVEDPWHAWKLHAREPGGPINARHAVVSGPVGEGHEPGVQHAR